MRFDVEVGRWRPSAVLRRDQHCAWLCDRWTRSRGSRERPGAEIGLQQVGYLFLLTDPADVTAFEKNTALQNSMGVPSRMISADEAGQLSTLANVDDVLAASVCMRDGHATPDAVVLGYATAARAMGVSIATHCPVTGIDVVDGDITGVRTARGTVATSTVICVAGAWSPAIAAMCGVDLPVQPVARPIWYTEPMPTRPAHVPMTIDFTTGFYFHTEGPGLLFGMADPDQPPGFDSPMRPDWLEVVGDVVAHRAPALLEVGIAGGWHGFYETTPDHNALIGEAARRVSVHLRDGLFRARVPVGPRRRRGTPRPRSGSHPAG